jgi:ABC-type polysaccharide/polyol phosphate transport system ATPase subunit
MTVSSTSAPADESPCLVKVVNVRKKYCRDLRRSLWYAVRDVFDALTLRPPNSDKLREFEFWAIDDISFEVRRGDSLGLLGRNGAGKSTLLKLITGQRSLSAGTITTRGRIVALTELGLGFNQALTGRENAYVNAAVHGFTREDFAKIIEEIIDFSGIREFIDSAVQTYSTGMKARLGFSIATHLNPDILVVDEVLAVGDLEFRRKCVRHILTYLKGGGSVILVAHDPYLIQSMCNRCIVLERGKVTFDGSGIDGVNFHFEVGRSSEYTTLSANTGTSAVGLTNSVAAAEAAQAEELAALPKAPQRALPPLTPEQPIIVDDIEVISLDGGPVVTGKPVKVFFRYRSLRPADITWGFTICTSDLQTSIASCVKGLDGDHSTVLAGEGVLVAILPDFTLQPGVYAIRGGIGDALSLTALSIKGYRDSPHFFTVVPGDVSRTANYKLLHNDLVDIRVEWKN